MEIQRHLSPYAKDDIRYVPNFDEQVQRLDAATRDEVAEMYAEFVGATYSEASAVGDFDPAELQAMLTEHFGNWKTPRPYARIGRDYMSAEADDVVIQTPDKANALFAMGMNVELRDDDPDYPAVFMANYILGGNPSSRFMTRIRQNEGLSYGCGTMLQAGSLDRAGAFFGFGMCAPENAEKAMNAGREELERLLAAGVEEQELDDAKKGYRQQLGVRLSNDAQVASMLTTSLVNGRTLSVDAERLEAIGVLTPDEVTQAMQRYVDPSQLVLIRAGDFSKSATPDSK